EAADRRHGREIEMPDVVGACRGHDARGRTTHGRPLWLGIRGEHLAYGRCADVKGGAREDTGDAPGAHPWAKRLQASHDVGDEVRESVHRLGDPHERAGPFVVESLRP